MSRSIATRCSDTSARNFVNVRAFKAIRLSVRTPPFLLSTLIHAAWRVSENRVAHPDDGCQWCFLTLLLKRPHFICVRLVSSKASIGDQPSSAVRWQPENSILGSRMVDLRIDLSCLLCWNLRALAPWLLILKQVSLVSPWHSRSVFSQRCMVAAMECLSSLAAIGTFVASTSSVIP